MKDKSIDDWHEKYKDHVTMIDEIHGKQTVPDWAFDLAQAIKTENTMLLKAMVCSCIPAALAGAPRNVKCERCKQLELREE